MKRNPAWLMAGLVVFGSFTSGPRIQQVKKHEIRAVDAPAAH